MSKITAWKIRVAYGIFLAAITVLLGLLYIFECADIYYSGLDSVEIFTYEIVAERLSMLLIPTVLWVVAVIVGYVLSTIVPYVKGQKTEKRKSVQLQKNCLPARKNISHIVVWSVCTVFAVVTSIATIVYLIVLSLSDGADINVEILVLLKNVLPLLFMTCALSIGALIYECVNAHKGQRICVYVVRLVIFSVAVVFLVIGIFNGGKDDVLMKAINICTECIGLG